MEFLIILVIVAITIIVFIIGFYFIIFKNKIEKYVENNSKSLKELEIINKRYEFYEVNEYDMTFSLDNENIYNDLYCEDYLIYKLLTIKSNIIVDINHTRLNKKLYESYLEEVNKIDSFGMFDKKMFITKQALKLERKAFDDLKEVPVVEFEVVVTMNRTDLNGNIFNAKMNIFDSDEIIDLIKRINNKNGSYYKDEEIWNSISKVERAKVANKIRFMILNRDHNRCCCCGRKENLEIDHIKPISKGGKSVIENLQTLCHNCNVEKGEEEIDYR